MSEDEEKKISRRSVFTHVGAVVSGWLLGTFLDPLRRTINRLIADTPFGRRAKVSFSYSESLKPEDDGYMLHIANNGEETAEQVAAHIAFQEKIVDYELQDWTNSPPVPATTIEITDGGIAKIQVESVRREFFDHFNPIQIHLAIDQDEESTLAYRIDDDEEMFLSYQYSWTFMGERYYESTDHHIAQPN